MNERRLIGGSGIIGGLRKDLVRIYTQRPGQAFQEFHAKTPRAPRKNAKKNPRPFASSFAAFAPLRATSSDERPMLEITPRIQIAEGELHWTFVRAGGPGGQNVNKVASKAVVRWQVRETQALPQEVKQRFLAQQHGRITVDGELVLSSQRYRDQDRNRQDCLEKLQVML